MSVIANTTVISNFASLGQLDLLRRLFQTLHISAAVYEEVRSGLEEGYSFYATIDQFVHPFAETGWIHLISMADEQELCLFGTLLTRLHQGEASCLAIARQRGWILLSDDQSAREEARRLEISLSGSVGCLVLAVERRVCTLEEANDWLLEMIRQGYWSPVTDLTPLLKC